MARPEKMGLDYFNIDVDQEDNLSLVEAKHGISGYGIVIKLWRKIYQLNGYYCEWEEENEYLFAKDIGVTIEQLREVVETCFKGKIFSREKYQEHKVLTSSGTQKRWKRIVTDSKRKCREIDKKYLLIEFTPEKIEFTTEETKKTPEENTQSKLKETKGNKKKEETVLAPSAPERNTRVGTRKSFVPPTLLALQDYVQQAMGDPKKSRPWPADKCRNFSAQIFDHYEANGWVQGKSRKPIVDWKAAVRTCIRNEMEKTQNGTTAAKLPEIGTNTPAVSPPATPTPAVKIDKTANEINYLFERYLEDRSKVTVISMESHFYDYLKSNGLISFSKEEVDSIRTDSINSDPSCEKDNVRLNKKMKCFGVLLFFKKQLEAGKKIIFNVDRKETAAA